jgi:branched-chain amino acid transport system substrate-binding protein
VRKLIACGVALVAAVAFMVPGALGSAEQTPGVTARTIVVGGTFPLTGPAAAYAPIPLGMKAYFAYVNKRRGPDGKRGVMGRQIVWKYYDHGYNTATSLQLARKLVQEDKVFATVGDLGTEPVQASRSYMNSAKVPQVFVSTGASEFGTKYKEFPWTIGWQPDYISEGRLYGLHVKANQRGKKIAIIYQNDDYGKDYLYGFKYALGPAYVRENVVAQEAIEATATSAASQMTRIRASGAEVFAIFQLPTPTVRTIGTARALGYNPDQIYMNSVATVKPATDGIVATVGPQYANGIISAAYTKDPNSPTWNNDGQVFYGVAKAESFVQALYKAGKNLTRQRLMNAVLSMNQPNKFLLPKVRQKTSRQDHFVISQMQLERFNANTKIWARFGPLVDGRPGSK